MSGLEFDFTSLFSKKQIIFKNESVFQQNFTPEHIIHRNGELTRLTNHFKAITSQDSLHSGKHILIQGPVGSGKTTVVKYFGNKLKEYFHREIDSGRTRILFFHLNCRRQKSWHLILTSILRQLITAFPSRGFSSDELLTILVNFLKESNQQLLLCLDEIDYVLLKPKDIDMLYSLIRHHEEVDQGCISTILVTRNPQLSSLFDSALLSSLSQFNIVFEPYSTNQLIDILSLRAKDGLHENSYSSEIIKEIASFAFKEKDTRHVIDLLWRSAKIAEQEDSLKIDFKHIQKAQDSVLPIKQSIITDLSSEVKKVLLALALLLRDENGGSFVTTSELRQKYAEICKKSNERPRKQTQFWNYLQELEKYNLIKLEVKNRHQNGKSAGRTSKIEIADVSVKMILNLLDSGT